MIPIAIVIHQFCKVCNVGATVVVSQPELSYATKRYGGNSIYAVQGYYPKNWYAGVCPECQQVTHAESDTI